MIRKVKSLKQKKHTGKILLYILLMCVSVLTAALLYVFNAEGAVGFIVMMLSIYMFAGSLIRLCRLSERFRDSVLCSLDLLFFLP